MPNPANLNTRLILSAQVYRPMGPIQYANCGHRRRRDREGRHGGSCQGPEGRRRRVRPPLRSRAPAVERRSLPEDRRDAAGQRLPDAARVRRDLRRRARRSARRRQPPRARHPARHPLRARSLRELSPGPAARRSPEPAQGSRPEGHQLRRVPREHRRRVCEHRRPLQGRHRRRGRDPGRDQHLQGRAPHHQARVRVCEGAAA